MREENVKSRERMREVLNGESGGVYFYINFREGSWYVEKNHIMPECMESETDDPVQAILKSGRVNAGDHQLFVDFAEKLRLGVESGIPDERMKITFRINSDDGSSRWYSMRLFLVKDRYLRVTEAVGRLALMSDREVMERNILYYYSADQNPTFFVSLIDKCIKENTDINYAFIQFDVVKFKLINDTYGEAVGTELLHFFQDTLGVYCHEGQLYSRLTADVFMVVTPYNEVEDIYRFIRGLEKRLSGYNGMKYTFAFGVYLMDDRSLPSRTMGDSAAIARMAIKGNALENIGFFNVSLKSDLINRKNIEDNMKSALDNGEFVMYLQPKYSISANTIIGAEALVRWNHHELGIIPPSEFIPVLEKNGFIIKLDEYIWDCACRQLRDWIDRGLKVVPISVNVSRVHLSNTGFIDYLDGLIKKYSLPKNLLELEITETIENINVNVMIKKAKSDGFTLLMDDFGSGYSSLNTLKTTPFDVLKIDRAFLSSSMESDRGQKIISHTISMSRDIGLDIIAEGVETREQAEFLQYCGCDAAQGFYYSKAVPVEDFEKLLFKHEELA